MNLDVRGLFSWYTQTYELEDRIINRPPSLSVPGATGGMRTPVEIYYLCIKRNIIIPRTVTTAIRSLLRRALSYPPGN